MPPETSPLKVIYLIQTDQGKCPYKIPKNSDVLMLQWQKEFEPNQYSFHFPNSTYQTGRNELYRRAIEKSEQNGYYYDYLIFVDDDLKLNFSLEDFEKELKKHKPCRMGPLYRTYVKNNYMKFFNNLFSCNFISKKGVHKINYIDHCFMAVRNDCAEKIFPYTLKYDSSSWSLATGDWCQRFFYLYPMETLIFNKFIVLNTKSRPYPRTFDELVKPKNIIISLKLKKNNLLESKTLHYINPGFLVKFLINFVESSQCIVKKLCLLNMKNVKY